MPANDVKELIAYAKANPGKLTFGSGSSSSRIAGEMLKSLGGIDIVHVPYRSNPQAVTDILGGQISLFFADISTTLPQVKAGKVKGFAVSTAQRSKLAPELPTMAEAGVAGYDLAAWFAAFAPAEARRSRSSTSCATRSSPPSPTTRSRRSSSPPASSRSRAPPRR